MQTEHIVTQYPDGRYVQHGCFADGAEIRIEEEYRHGRREGCVIQWFLSPPTQKRAECEYRNDVPHGRNVTWHADGTKQMECVWRDGKLDGVYSLYTGIGEPTTQYLYEEGFLKRVLRLVDPQGLDWVLPDVGTEVDVWKLGDGDRYTGHGPDLRDQETVPLFIRLRVPADAQRVTVVNGSGTYASRVESARVEEIVDRWGTHYESARFRPCGTTYGVGDVVHVDGFDPDPTIEYGVGIRVHRHRPNEVKSTVPAQWRTGTCTTGRTQ